MSQEDQASVEALRAQNTRLSAQVADLKGQLSALQALALRDPLTGIGNRRAFDVSLHVELERTKRSGFPTCLLLLDIVGFKSINDHYGHPTGDAALQHVAATLRAVTRQLDSVHRIGGDEFGAVLAGANAQAGTQVAARFASVLSEPFATSGAAVQICARYGLAATDDTGLGEAADLIAAADAMLYRK